MNRVHFQALPHYRFELCARKKNQIELIRVTLPYLTSPNLFPNSSQHIYSSCTSTQQITIRWIDLNNSQFFFYCLQWEVCSKIMVMMMYNSCMFRCPLVVIISFTCASTVHGWKSFICDQSTRPGLLTCCRTPPCPCRPTNVYPIMLYTLNSEMYKIAPLLYALITIINSSS